MKLILSIVNSEDSHDVINELTHSGFQVTKLATSGGFLKTGNTTMFVGVQDEKVDEVISIIEKTSSKRTEQTVPTHMEMSQEVYLPLPFEVTMGGATIFVLDVEQFKKL